MRKTQVVPKCRVGGMPTKLVKQRNKPKIIIAKSYGDLRNSLLICRKYNDNRKTIKALK
jgi:hypothetical protein